MTRKELDPPATQPNSMPCGRKTMEFWPLLINMASQILGPAYCAVGCSCENHGIDSYDQYAGWEKAGQKKGSAKGSITNLPPGEESREYCTLLSLWVAGMDRVDGMDGVDGVEKGTGKNTG